jgi:cytoskeletal protein CcmA (bactofilin family)
VSSLDLDVAPHPAPASPAVLAARRRRSLAVALGGGRETDLPMAKSSFADRWSPSPHDVSAVAVEAERSSDAGAGGTPENERQPPGMDGKAGAGGRRPTPPSASRLQLDDALVVPAGALVRGYLRCRALLLVGDIVGNVHCTGGPVVVRSGASLRGRLVAGGDVYVCGSVGDGGGGTVITTPGKLTLAPGARVEGDVRSGSLDLYDGALLRGTARGCED